MDGMMPPPGGMPMGPPLAGQAPTQQKSKDTVYGGSRRGRANFKNFMQQKSQVGVPQVQMPQMPQVPISPQPMLPLPAPQMMGALPSPRMGGLSSVGGLGQQADVGGGVGSAPMQFAEGGAVPELRMGMAADGPAVYLGNDRMMDPADMHQKMLRAGYGRDAILDSAAMLQDKAQHIVDDLAEYAGGARGGFGHTHEYGDGGHVHEFNEGGEVPRETVIAGQPHYLAYINPEEGDLLKGLGGAEAPGPGGIPSYFFHTSEARDKIKESLGLGGGDDKDKSKNDDRTIIGSSGNVSLDAIANEAVQNDPDTNFSYMGETYDNVFDYHDAIFGDDDSPSTSVDTTPVNTNITDTSSLSGIADASGLDFDLDPVVQDQVDDIVNEALSGSVDTSAKDPDLGVGMTNNTVTADELDSGFNNTTYGTTGGGNVTVADDSTYTDNLASGDTTSDDIIGSLSLDDVNIPFGWKDNGDGTMTTDTGILYDDGIYYDQNGGQHLTMDQAEGMNEKINQSQNYYEPPGFDFDGDGIYGEGSDVVGPGEDDPFDPGDDTPAPVTPTPGPGDDEYGGGETEVDVPPTPVAPPPVYTDMFGNEYGSAEEASAQDALYEIGLSDDEEDEPADVDPAGLYDQQPLAGLNVPVPESYMPTSEDLMPGITGTDTPRADEDAIRGLYGLEPLDQQEESDVLGFEDLMGGDGDDLVDQTTVPELEELSAELGIEAVGEDFTPTSAELYGDDVPEPLSVEDQVAQYEESLLDDYESASGEAYGGMDVLDYLNEYKADVQADIAMENLINTGALDDTIIEDGGLERASADFPTGPFEEPEMTGLEEVESALYDDETSYAVPDFLVDKTDQEIDAINTAAEAYREGGTEGLLDYRMDMTDVEPDEVSQEAIDRASEDVSALDRLVEELDNTIDIRDPEEDTGLFPDEDEVVTEQVTVDDVQNPDSNTVSDEMKQKLLDQYAQIGRDPGAVNAAEARLIQDVLNNSNIKMDQDRIDRIVETMTQNGATDEQIAQFKADNPVGTDLYGGDGSFGSNLKNVANDIVSFIIKQLSYGIIDPQKMSSDQAQEFLDAYRDTGKFVYDEDNPSVVIGVEDSDGNLVRGFGDYENTEDGVVKVSDVDDQTSDSDGQEACPEGYYRDPASG